MIFGSCAGYLTERASEWLLPGIESNWVPGDRIDIDWATRIAVAYNRILDRADDIVVFLHDDVELHPGARTKILEGLERYDVVGVIGARKIQSLAWWQGDMVGTLDESRGPISGAPDGEVDAVNGLLLAFRPGLRFDETYPGYHGYDIDICFQARAQGMTVGTMPIPLTHHTKGGYGDQATWKACKEIWKQKWG